jgi:hypothetical protein
MNFLAFGFVCQRLFAFISNLLNDFAPGIARDYKVCLYCVVQTVRQFLMVREAHYFQLNLRLALFILKSFFSALSVRGNLRKMI